MIASPPAEAKGIYELWPKQQRAMWLLGLDPWEVNPAPVEELFFGGQGGPGKSLFLRAALCYVALTMWPGCKLGLFRRKRTELFDTHLDRLHMELPPGLFVYKGDPDHEFRFKNGSVLQLRYCDHEDDVYHYLSTEWEGLFVDEATQFSPRQYTLLRSRVRSTRPGWRRLVASAGMPGGPGHMYFKQTFVDAGREGQPFEGQEVPPPGKQWRRCFLRARLQDNPALDYETYLGSLSSIDDPEMRRAMADGDWNLFAGQMFSTFRVDRHVCESFEVTPEWPRWSSLDYGYSDPTVWHGWARVPGGTELPIENERMRTRRGPRLLVFDEYYQREVVAQVAAMQILRRTGGRQTGPCWADPSVFNRGHDGGSIAAEYAAAGLRVSRGNNDRLASIQRIHRALLTHEEEPPELVVMENCTHLLSTLPNILRDSHNPEDMVTTGDDHPVDSARYGIMGGAPKRRSPPGGKKYLIRAKEVTR